MSKKNIKPEVKKVLQQYKQILKSKKYLGYALSSTFIACGFYIFIGSAPYIVINELGGYSADFGNWFLLVAIAFMFGSFCSGNLAKRIPIDTMISLGHGISLLAASILLLLFHFQCKRLINRRTSFYFSRES